MAVAGLDEQQLSRLQGCLVTVDDDHSRTFHDEQPLVRPSMKIVGTSLSAAGGKHHHGGLRTGIADR
jgi:hypothetical protein